MNTPELNKYFTVNNLYDNTTNNSRLLQFYDTASTVWLTEGGEVSPSHDSSCSVLHCLGFHLGLSQSIILLKKKIMAGFLHKTKECDWRLLYSVFLPNNLQVFPCRKWNLRKLLPKIKSSLTDWLLNVHCAFVRDALSVTAADRIQAGADSFTPVTAD